MVAHTNAVGEEGRDAGSDGVGITPVEIERLGRERSKVFKTIWAELGFCSSILGSMMMAVRLSPPFLEIHRSNFVTLFPGILHQWLQHRFPDPLINSRHSHPITNMASKRLLPRHWRLSPPNRSSRRHVWRLRRISIRPRMVSCSVIDRRLHSKLSDVDILSRSVRLRTCCVPAIWNPASGNFIPARPKKEFDFQLVWCFFPNGLLLRDLCRRSKWPIPSLGLVILD